MPRPNDLDDQQLLQRIAEGDSAALRELHAKTARPLHSMAMKILTSSAEAEEVIQDVFVLVWKNAHKFNFEKAKVFTWMAVMMKNRCIDRIRAKKRRIPYMRWTTTPNPQLQSLIQKMQSIFSNKKKKLQLY